MQLQTVNKLIRIFKGGLIASALLFLFLYATDSHGAISKKPQPNATGAVMYLDNPFIYKEGNLIGAVYVEKGALVVRIQPRATFSLFTEDILLCPGAAEKFGTKMNPVVITYERVAHITVEGIGCHRLESVDEVKNEPKYDLLP